MECYSGLKRKAVQMHGQHKWDPSRKSHDMLLYPDHHPTCKAFMQGCTLFPGMDHARILLPRPAEGGRPVPYPTSHLADNF
jgi:hypothetical protein